jgi:oxysterol-binding protein-related protein 8
MSSPSTGKNLKKEEKEDDKKEVVVEEVEEEQSIRGLLFDILNQLRLGLDIKRIIIPCNFLEPRSLLERLSDLLLHSDILIDAARAKSKEERILLITKFYLAGWYIKPKGVKKPYNPVLGETFRCSYTQVDGSITTYFAEQVKIKLITKR